MKYGEIASQITDIAQKLTELADKLNRIQEATPAIHTESEAKLAQKLTLTVTETAEALSISKATMYQLIHRNDFPSLSIGRRVLIPREKLIEWINNHCGEDL